MKSHEQAQTSAMQEKQLVTPEQIAEARRYRDDLWSAILTTHVWPDPDGASDIPEGMPEDPVTAFEPAIQEADTLVDHRFRNAKAAAKHAEASRLIDETKAQIAYLNDECSALENEDTALKADWRFMWAEYPFDPLDPELMSAWTEKYHQIQGLIVDREKAQTSRDRLRQQEEDAREQLVGELQAVGVDPAAKSTDTLSVLLEMADITRNDLEKAAATRQQLRQELDLVMAEIERRNSAVAQAKKDLSNWRNRWRESLTVLRLPDDSTLAAVAEHIETIGQMRDIAGRMRITREDRIAKIRRDIEDFESKVRNLVEAVAPNLKNQPAEDAMLEIEKRVDDVRKRRVHRDATEKEIVRFQKDIAGERQVIAEINSSIQSLRDQAQAETDAELRTAIERSETLRKCEHDLQTVLTNLTTDADGHDIDSLVVECAHIDIATAAAAEKALTTQLEDLKRQLGSAVQASTAAQADLDAVSGGGAAALAEAQRQSAITEMATVAGRYVQVRGAAILLQWAIDRYRQEKQVPLLRRAAELFAIMTSGSFDRLEIAYDSKDQPQLRGVRPNNEAVAIDGMSSGTTDQLFLALRVASIEDYLDQAQALPFIADDLFINFDDERAATGLRVLGKLAEKTQVLLFTHHPHLVDLAKSVLGPNVSLSRLQYRVA